jgi:hypothetical protein
VAVVVLLAVGCGQSASTAGSAGSTGAPTATTGGVGTVSGAGPEAAFAPAGSLLYMRTAGTGPQWDALSPMRARVKGLNAVNPSNGPGNFLRLLTASDFADGSSVMLHALSGESAEVLISNRGVKGEAGPGQADSMFYSGVADHAALEKWIESHSTRVGSDGGYTLYTGNTRYTGDSALSQSVWLWGDSLGVLRESIATAAGTRPSLLDDPRFMSAFAALNQRGAALVAYTRGDLATELGRLWAGPSVAPQGVFTSLTDGLGLADTALAIGANAHGVWMRAAPHVLARGYHPGPSFTPSLFGQVPPNSVIYVGVDNGGAQLSQFDRVLAPILGSGDTSDPDPVSSEIGTAFHVTPEDLGAIGTGEQAWFAGQTSGAAFRPGDPSRAAAALAAEAARNAPLGVTSGRSGDIVWIHDHPASGSPVPGPSPAELVSWAGLPHSVSWVLAVNLSFLSRLSADDSSATPPNPEDSVSGAVVSTTPAADGRYGLDVFLDIG